MTKNQPHVKFSRICLLSEVEKSGLWLEVPDAGLFVVAENGFGKSVVAKSLFYAFGAVPHDMDDDWEAAKPVYLIEFTVDEVPHQIIRIEDRFILFEDDQRIAVADKMGAELMPIYKELFAFELTMKNQKGEVVLPPPGYIFGPYYIDQDGGWSDTWSSFKDLYLPQSREALANFHAGVRPGGYYRAQSSRAQSTRQYETADRKLTSLNSLSNELQLDGSGASLAFEEDAYDRRIGELVEQLRALLSLIGEDTNTIRDLVSERDLWEDQKVILRRSLEEMSGLVKAAEKLPENVHCPTCGQDYSNGIVERFGLAADSGPIRVAYERAESETQKLDKQIEELSTSSEALAERRDRVRRTLDARRAGVSLEEIIEGKAEALLRGKISTRAAAILQEMTTHEEEIKIADREMRSFAKSKPKIVEFFELKLKEALHDVDVTVDVHHRDLSGKKLGRGSEGARGILGYYSAFIDTAREFGTSANFPFVVDSPRQQGQDDIHILQVYDFLNGIHKTGQQTLVFTESLPADFKAGLKTVYLANEKKKVLRSDDCTAVKIRIDSLLRQ